jgi:hypothetical protein
MMMMYVETIIHIESAKIIGPTQAPKLFGTFGVSKESARPISVKGCFRSPRMGSADW